MALGDNQDFWVVILGPPKGRSAKLLTASNNASQEKPLPMLRQPWEQLTHSTAGSADRPALQAAGAQYWCLQVHNTVLGHEQVDSASLWPRPIQLPHSKSAVNTAHHQFGRAPVTQAVYSWQMAPTRAPPPNHSTRLVEGAGWH
jgi:hypothetical protein